MKFKDLFSKIVFNKDKLISIFLCWDFILAVILTFVVLFIIPVQVPGNFAKDVYEVGISVLSIIFSVYFAALTIIISAIDDGFVRFLEKEGHYSELLFTFKFTIFTIFLALMCSIVLFTYSGYKIEVNLQYSQSYGLLVFYVFISSYSLFAVFNSTIDSLRYSKYRMEFFKLSNPDEDEDNVV